MSSYLHDSLRKLFGNTPKIWVMLRHSSPSNLTRKVRVFTITDDRRIEDISQKVAAVLNLKHDREYQAVVIKGSGYSVTFDLADQLSDVLYDRKVNVDYESL